MTGRLGVDALLDGVAMQEHSLGLGQGGRKCVRFLVRLHKPVHFGHQLQFHVFCDGQGGLQKLPLRLHRIITHRGEEITIILENMKRIRGIICGLAWDVKSQGIA